MRNAAKNASSSAGAERVGDDDDADVAQDARDEERARDDQPGAGERARSRSRCVGSRRARGWASR